MGTTKFVPVPVAAQSKAWVCCHSIAGVVGSNPTGGMDVRLLRVLCVLSGRCLCDELITRPEESYRLWWVVVCDLETSWMRRPWSTGGCCAKNKQTNKCVWAMLMTLQREWLCVFVYKAHILTSKSCNIYIFPATLYIVFSSWGWKQQAPLPFTLCKALHPRRLESSSIDLWEPEILYI
jgi:hypothetical protein